MSTCKKCNGSGSITTIGKDGMGTHVSCPSCSGHSLPSENFEASWSKARKEFKAKIVFDISDEQQAQLNHASLPQLIADNSFCDCGSQLSLGDFAISKKGYEVIFTGKFHCASCNRKRKTIGKIVVSAFSSIKKLKLSGTGVEVERFEK